MPKPKFFRWLSRIIIVILWLIAVTGFHHVYNWRIVASIVLSLAPPVIVWRFRLWKIFFYAAIGAFLLMLAGLSRVSPSNDRTWRTEFSVLPKISITGELVIIRGFRDFRWKSVQEFEPAWEDRTLDLRKLSSLDLIVEPFKDSDYMAHTMLRFGFADQGSVVVSVEARRDDQETYNLIAGAFREFELIYVFGSEEDLLNLRAVHRGTQLYVYPIKAERQFIIELFKGLAASANALHRRPQFYRSIRDNCTTTLVHHFDRAHKERIGYRRETLLPALTGKLLYKMGYMATELSYEDAKDHFRVDERLREIYSRGNHEPNGR